MDLKHMHFLSPLLLKFVSSFGSEVQFLGFWSAVYQAVLILDM